MVRRPPPTLHVGRLSLKHNQIRQLDGTLGADRLTATVVLAEVRPYQDSFASHKGQGM